MPSKATHHGHFLSACRNSLCGIKDVLNETAFRQEVAFGVVHYALIAILALPFSEKLVLSVLWPVVLSAELVNSAVEKVVDHVSPEWNEFAKHAKDFCSAAVGLLILTCLGAWVAVLYHAYAA